MFEQFCIVFASFNLQQKWQGFGHNNWLWHGGHTATRLYGAFRFRL